MKFIIIITMLLTACSSSPTIPATDKQKVAPNEANRSTIYVFDDVGGMFGGGLIVANGKTVGKIGGRNYTWFQVTPGKLKLSMNDPGIKSRKMSARVLNVQAGKSYFIKYKIIDQPNDGALLADILSRKSLNKDIFRPSDLQTITKSEGLMLTKKLTLVGNNFK